MASSLAKTGSCRLRCVTVGFFRQSRTTLGSPGPGLYAYEILTRLLPCFGTKVGWRGALMSGFEPPMSHWPSAW